ncbi:hypothetical protein VTJ49DRAFT_6301 [Mycothermus thermophilus]|uniref:F-box domain-containing protein n=1 Tax=Humicola insolens TaxID=85995 RepID=A0ABR3V1J8_HUMIN
MASTGTNFPAALKSRQILEPREGSVEPSTPDATPRARSDSASSGTPRLQVHTTSPEDDTVVYDTCEYVLKETFGVRLDEVALAGAASAVHESVSYCLDELAHILRGIGLNDESSWSRGESNTFSAAWLAHSGGSGSGTSSNDDAGGNGLKRTSGGGGGGDGTDPSGGSGDGSAGGKRRKVSSTQVQPPKVRLSCPFRKRNPVRFNVREFHGCAVQDFPDIYLVKRHVKSFHRQNTPTFPYPRCRRPMGSQEALDEHASVDVDQICPVRKVSATPDPEDGITTEIEGALNERKADGKIDSWEALWNLLFPGDRVIPEPDFIPPTELDEVYAQFHSEKHMDQLRQRVGEALGSTNHVDDIVSVFESHIESVFEASRHMTSQTAIRWRRLRLQTSQQFAAPQSSMLLNPRPPAPKKHGSLPSESSASPFTTLGCASPKSSLLLNPKYPAPRKQGSLRSESSISSPIPPLGWAPTPDANREWPSETGRSTPMTYSPSAVGFYGIDTGSPGGCMVPFSGSRPGTSHRNAAVPTQVAANMYPGLGLLEESYAIPLPGQQPSQPKLGGAPIMLGAGHGASQAPVTVLPMMVPFNTRSSSQALNVGSQTPSLRLQPSDAWMLEEPGRINGFVNSPVNQNIAPTMAPTLVGPSARPTTPDLASPVAVPGSGPMVPEPTGQGGNFIHGLIGLSAGGFSETVRLSISSLSRKDHDAPSGSAAIPPPPQSRADATAGLAEDGKPPEPPSPPGLRPPHLLSLPPEIALMILRHLDFADIIRLRRTCKQLRALANPKQVQYLFGADRLRLQLLSHCRVCLRYDPSRSNLLSTNLMDLGYPLSSRCVKCAIEARDPRIRVGKKIVLASADSVWVCRWCGFPIIEGAAFGCEQMHRECYRRYNDVLFIFFILGWIQLSLGIVAAALAWRYYRHDILMFAPTVTNFILLWICLSFLVFRGHWHRTYHYTLVLEFLILGLWIPPVYHVAREIAGMDAGSIPGSAKATLAMFVLNVGLAVG